MITETNNTVAWAPTKPATLATDAYEPSNTGNLSTGRTHRLARASLCTSHEVSALANNGDGVLLYRGGASVPTALNIFHGGGKKATLLKCGDVLGRVSSSDFNRYLIIPVEVYSCIDSGEDGLLVFWWRWRNVYFSRTRFYKGDKVKTRKLGMDSVKKHRQLVH